MCYEKACGSFIPILHLPEIWCTFLNPSGTLYNRVTPFLNTSIFHNANNINATNTERETCCYPSVPNPGNV